MHYWQLSLLCRIKTSPWDLSTRTQEMSKQITMVPCVLAGSTFNGRRSTTWQIPWTMPCFPTRPTRSNLEEDSNSGIVSWFITNFSVCCIICLTCRNMMGNAYSTMHPIFSPRLADRCNFDLQAMVPGLRGVDAQTVMLSLWDKMESRTHVRKKLVYTMLIHCLKCLAMS